MAERVSRHTFPAHPRDVEHSPNTTLPVTRYGQHVITPYEKCRYDKPLVFRFCSVCVAKCAIVFAVRFTALGKVIFDYLINSQFKYTVFGYISNS